MKITLLPGAELSPDLASAWSALAQQDASLDSPFFHPAFTQSVAAVRSDVEVALLEQHGVPVGFFPFQRGSGDVGRPVGGRLSDFQGIIARADCPLDARQLLAGARLAAWHFDHLLASQPLFQPYHWTTDDSPFIQTTCSFEDYLAQRRAAGTDELAKTLRKKRKLQRELAPVRFEPLSTQAEVLETLMRWKAQQYERSQIVNLFSFDWTERLLRLLLEREDPQFCGMMSALYVGDKLAAVHYGIRCGRVLHSWFPAYRQELRKYSPGSQLLLEIVKAAGSLGIERIDLGKGPERYKTWYMTGATPLAEGSIDLRPARRTLRRLWHRTHHWVRESPLRRPASVPWRWIRQVRDQIQYR